VKLAVVSFTADSFRKDVNVGDADISSYFDAHKDEFKIGEKRKIRYLLLDIDALRQKVVVPSAEIDRAYNNNIEQYSTPGQVRASHILLKTEGKDDAAVKAKAEDLLKQARGGADFAELAKKYSEDDSNKANGGDLDYFGRGRMVAEFDQVAFTLEPGKISDVVKTQFGYHIIKVTDKRQPRAHDVRQVIKTSGLRAPAGGDLATSLEKEIQTSADLIWWRRKVTDRAESGFRARPTDSELGPRRKWRQRSH
jgi:peptidyl-prolyl cis-trans isomerase D